MLPLKAAAGCWHLWDYTESILTGLSALDELFYAKKMTFFTSVCITTKLVMLALLWCEVNCWSITFNLPPRKSAVCHLDFCHVLSECIIHLAFMNSFRSDKCRYATVKTPMSLLMHGRWCCCRWKVAFESAEDKVSISSTLKSDFIFFLHSSHLSSSYVNSQQRGVSYWFLHLIAPIPHTHSSLPLTSATS